MNEDADRCETELLRNDDPTPGKCNRNAGPPGIAVGIVAEGGDRRSRLPREQIYRTAAVAGRSDEHAITRRQGHTELLSAEECGARRQLVCETERRCLGDRDTAGDEHQHRLEKGRNAAADPAHSEGSRASAMPLPV